MVLRVLISSEVTGRVLVKTVVVVASGIVAVFERMFVVSGITGRVPVASEVAERVAPGMALVPSGLVEASGARRVPIASGVARRGLVASGVAAIVLGVLVA